MNSLQIAKSTNSWLFSIWEREPPDLTSLLINEWYKKPLHVKHARQLGIQIIIGFSYVAERVAKIAGQNLPKLILPYLPISSLGAPQIRQESKSASPFSMPPKYEPKPATFADIPLNALEVIAMHLSLSELSALAQVSKQTTLLAGSLEVWQMWSARFSLALEPKDVVEVMRPVVRYFTLDEQDRVALRHNLGKSSMRAALASYPRPCWIMQAGGRAKCFHFSLRSPCGEIKLYRNVALGCPLSERFITISKIINDERYCQIKVRASAS